MSLLSPDPTDTISVAVYEYTLTGNQKRLVECLDRLADLSDCPAEESFLVFSCGKTNRVTLYLITDIGVVINGKYRVFHEWITYPFTYSNGRMKRERRGQSVRNPSKTPLGRKIYILSDTDAKGIRGIWRDLR